jgi:hypothetical protein
MLTDEEEDKLREFAEFAKQEEHKPVGPICPMTNHACSLLHERRTRGFTEEELEELFRLARMSRTTRSIWAVVLRLSMLIAAIASVTANLDDIALWLKRIFR